MSPKAEELLKQVLELPPEERARLIDQVNESLERVDPEWEEAWIQEILRREADIESGKDKPIPVEQALAKIRRGLRGPT